jgi:hypothetical protein
MRATLILVAMTISADAQSCLDMCPRNPLVQPLRIYEYSTDIGRAMSLCEKHSHAPWALYPEGGTPREYEDDWKACYKIRQEWEKSETAKALQAAKEQDARDKAYVEQIAKDLH